MFCTAGLVVSWALTIQATPALHMDRQKAALACYQSQEECLDGATAAGNVLALQGINYRPGRISCEREQDFARWRAEQRSRNQAY